jgi:hypothetical protein
MTMLVTMPDRRRVREHGALAHPSRSWMLAGTAAPYGSRDRADPVSPARGRARHTWVHATAGDAHVAVSSSPNIP